MPGELPTMVVSEADPCGVVADGSSSRGWNSWRRIRE